HLQALVCGVNLGQATDVVQNGEDDGIHMVSDQKGIGDGQHRSGINNDKVVLRPQLCANGLKAVLGQGLQSQTVAPSGRDEGQLRRGSRLNGVGQVVLASHQFA